MSVARGKGMQSAVRSATMGFKPSLEMRENVDFLLAPALATQEVLTHDATAGVSFDTIMELNAPLCQTHVVLFLRYWVSADSYRVSVVWAEPHAGSLNFPVYPPTLSIISDPSRFVIKHQIQGLDDGVFPKPLGPRGPFTHRFNSYALSDIRHAEQETRSLFLHGGLFPLLLSGDTENCGARSMAYRRCIVRSERPIVVGFPGGGPTITISGETRRYSELETVQDEGGRRWLVDCEPVKFPGRVVSLPTQITVLSASGSRILRSAQMYDHVECPVLMQLIEADTERFGRFDTTDIACRELLLKYWMKDPHDIPAADVNALRCLHSCVSTMATTGTCAGERLKHVDTLVQLDWMLADSDRLERDFCDYLRLLEAKGLNRMVLFGAQNLVETTMRWGHSQAADKLLSLWLEAAFRGDPDSVVEFASTGIAGKRFWTTAALMEKVLMNRRLSVDQRFALEAYRCVALAKIHAMLKVTHRSVMTEWDRAQVRWVDAKDMCEVLWGEIERSLRSGLYQYCAIEKPTREQRAMKSRLDVIEQWCTRNRSISDESRQ